MEQPKTVLVDVDILNKIVTYLAGKPYVEVVELIARVQKSVSDNRMAAQSKEKENE